VRTAEGRAILRGLQFGELGGDAAPFAPGPYSLLFQSPGLPDVCVAVNATMKKGAKK
jgi:hypothetical protein